MVKENIFYTYIYLDPRKKGPFKYGEYTFDYEPFYVGKGQNGNNRNQYKSHLLEAGSDRKLKRCSNTHKIAKIRKILKENIEPIILKVENDIFERNALDLEIWLIWSIGRSDLKLGPLTNQTDGGDGVIGVTGDKMKRVISDEQKMILSNRMKGKKLRLGIKHTTETIDKIKKSTIGKKRSKHFSEKMRIKMRGNTYLKGNIISNEQKNLLRLLHSGNCYSAKIYKIIFPDGHIEIIRNMVKFCIKFNLRNDAMSLVACGKQQSHRGYSVLYK